MTKKNSKTYKTLDKETVIKFLISNLQKIKNYIRKQTLLNDIDNKNGLDDLILFLKPDTCTEIYLRRMLLGLESLYRQIELSDLIVRINSIPKSKLNDTRKKET